MVQAAPKQVAEKDDAENRHNDVDRDEEKGCHWGVALTS